MICDVGAVHFVGTVHFQIIVHLQWAFHCQRVICFDLVCPGSGLYCQVVRGGVPSLKETQIFMMLSFSFHSIFAVEINQSF